MVYKLLILLFRMKTNNNKNEAENSTCHEKRENEKRKESNQMFDKIHIFKHATSSAAYDMYSDFLFIVTLQYYNYIIYYFGGFSVYITVSSSKMQCTHLYQ